MQQWWIDTRDKPGLLWAFLRNFVNVGRASFEGDLKGLELADLPDASLLETEVLKRQTIAPPLDFVTMPITADTIRILQTRLSTRGLFDNSGGLNHVQIEHADQLVLGAYDNFHRRCVVAYEPTPESLLKDLMTKGIIRSYDVAG